MYVAIQKLNYELIFSKLNSIVHTFICMIGYSLLLTKLIYFETAYFVSCTRGQGRIVAFLLSTTVISLIKNE